MRWTTSKESISNVNGLMQMRNIFCAIAESNPQIHPAHSCKQKYNNHYTSRLYHFCPFNNT